MLKDLKKTAKHTFVYAFGNIASKLIGIILIPLYTNAEYLSHADYGALAVLEATSQVLIGILTMAMGSGLSRWYWDKRYSGEQGSIFYTTIASLIVMIVPVSAILVLSSGSISQLLFSSFDYSYLLRLTILASVIQIINNQTLTLVKLQSRSLFFASIQIVKLSLVLSLILWGILYKHQGLDAIWQANLIGEFLVFIILLPYVIKNFVIKFHKQVFKEMLIFGFPLMLTSVSGVILATVDRYMLSSMSGLEKTGVYSLGFRIANTLKIVISTSLASALIPLRTKKIDEPGNQRFYSKNLTYVGFIFLFALTAISLFSLELLKIFTNAKLYWEANYIVPIISFALFFGVMKNYSVMGVFIKKKTKVIALLVFLTGIVNIGLNLVLIPIWDIYGAAYATLLSQIFLFITITYASQKAYLIPYEWRKVVVMTMLSIIYVCIGLAMADIDIWVRLLLKSILLVSFPFVLYLFNFYEEVEIKTIRNTFKAWRNPKKVRENFKRFLK